MRLSQVSVLFIAASLIAGGIFGLSIDAVADNKIGVASVVRNQVEGRGARRLAVGSEVFSNERIRTGDASSAQLMFVDKTVLSMGPKAELVLDKYVYNPNRGTGQVVVNAVQGSMRFVTGAQNPTSYSVKTPVATLGIRGTIVHLQITKLETFIGVFEGTLTIRLLNGNTITVSAGQYVKIASNGELRSSGPFKGDEPNNLTFPDYIRIDEINQLNAIDARNFIPRGPVDSTNPNFR
jgi:hypothetical protein